MTATVGLPVLVTGAGGFIGARLVQRLLEAGCPVEAVYRRRSSAERARVRLGNPLHRPLVLDSETGRAPANAPRGRLRGAIHLASPVPSSRSVASEDADELMRRGVEASARALLELVGDRAPILVNASSTTVYDETLRGVIDETAPLRPASAYGAGKLSCEGLFREHGQRLGIAVANLRLSQVWGPDEPHGLFVQRVFIPAARSGGSVRLVRGGRDVKDLLWRDDAVAALILAVEGGASGAFNVSSGKGMSVREIAEAVARHTGRSGRGGDDFIELEDDGGEAVICVYDHERARRELGYAPLVSMSEGLRLLCR